ncbi:unnamed protein product [marine sediment metagenome]|uniref:Uncharacterized protein n=1 Tax=marine sediment metagenome TaxID=412755 RepID=X1RM41_9ZZZZ
MEKVLQIDILKEKKLNSHTSSCNCNACGGLPVVSLSGSLLPNPSSIISQSLQSKSKEITENFLNSFKSPETSPEGVYIYTVNIQHFTKDVQSTLLGEKPTNAEMLHKHYPNILFFDSAWRLLNPSTWYIKLLKECLNISAGECGGYYTGFLFCVYQALKKSQTFLEKY